MTTLSELRRAIEDRDGTSNVQTERNIAGEIYVAANIQLTGIDLHELHEEHDFNIRSTWYDPVREKLDLCFYPIESE